MIAILKYNAGNVQSVENAIQRLGYDTVVTDDVEVLKSADKVIFPGVGEASSAMVYLVERGLDKVIRDLTQPVLGICLGMQLLCKSSEEGNVEGLGIFDNEVKLFPSDDIVPHMGWNDFSKLEGALFKGIKVTDDFYFVHSYYATLNESTIAINNYIVPFSAALQKGNFYAVQFHPEKSGRVGELLLKNFLEL
ncbi:imidazole glycerol phosphate synthase subunit HisH [Myroides marinus]|uniref:imidazole glycerol phosphate synthase subunit HisH n=1 Tax=Myroides marinus TaxID=703342 RepID=UPI0007422684|nr:imidazole glycerol phosphate synthase subunit HisH [Myroides marinus]KUF42937.1 imidazole glycerol phosphate synthase subunit HisH [Myroides marinus]MDM1367049.1 imidazole glycerol phosphate synthase subunit HisH [Myroides marinus]MDM1372199.1 imidazole glycerol phosphate synthase subunit HisH [Myroides marinus]MDM1374779.1 imidazole glycerol phosphate synthase subunit HisH [Myroides marinus]MDM1381502.1 imidazole glycerol phosphate synthase subunit HisH [Myroides marinus]